MSVTIGSFSTNRLKAQPFGYDGSARFGRTATTVELSGLVRPSEWLTLKTVYDTWQASRINDVDTSTSQVVGTTVSVSASANGITWSGRACWFLEAPAATQVGSLVQVSAVVVDAAQALASYLKDEASDVDCAKITADLNKKKEEADCELAALATGLVDDFAEQGVTREVMERTAELGARASSAGVLAGLDLQFEVQDKGARLGALGSYAAAIGSLDSDIEVVERTARLAGDAPNAGVIAGLGYQEEIQQKTAQLAAFSTYAGAISSLDVDLDIAQRTAELAAKEGGSDEVLAGLGYQEEIQEKTAQVAVIATYAAAVAGLDASLDIAQQTAALGLPTATAQSLAGLGYQSEIREKTAQLAVISTYAAAIAVLDTDLEVEQRTAQLAAQGATQDALTTLDYEFEILQKTSQAGLVGDFAGEIAELDADIDIARRTAELAATASTAQALAGLDYQSEIQGKTAQVAVVSTYAADIAGLDADLDIAQRTAGLAANETRAEAIAELDYEVEIQQKTAQVAVVSTYAADIAELDQDLEVAQSNARVAANDPAKRGTIIGNEYTIEIANADAEIAAITANFAELKEVRETKALYDKLLSESLPSFGTTSLGGATISLTESSAGAFQNTSFSLTASGVALISGSPFAVDSSNIVGIITGGGSSDVLAWYKEAVEAEVESGSLFPLSPPEFSTETVISGGVKTTRTTVRISVVTVP